MKCEICKKETDELRDFVGCMKLCKECHAYETELMEQVERDHVR